MFGGLFMKKQIIAIIVSVIMIISSVPLAVSAKAEKVCPTIIVPGYSASYLYLVEDGATSQIWGSFEGLNIADVVLANIAKLGVGLGAAAFGMPEYFVEVVGNGLLDILGDLAYTKNGLPVKETVTYPNDPAITNFSYLIEEEGGAHAAEFEIMSDVADMYGENGFDYIFSFQTDFRLNIVDAVEGLRKYIDDVLAYTGAEKVNIYAVSYGGQLTSAYLNLYGHEGKINNAVLTVPAIGGAALAYDALSANVHLDEETLFKFIENGMMLEEDINWLMKAHSLGFLDKILNLLVDGAGRELLGYWGSIWDFVPSEYYETLKNKYLDPIESKNLIEKSDYFHYEILPAMHDKLQQCIDNGTNVYIVAGTDSPAVSGLREQSDGIILVNGATGADCAPYGLRFSDGYTGKHSSCSDITHNHMSPAMNIDASTAYIPEQTWFISGLFHGMTWKDEYTKNLCSLLLFSDKTVSVHSFEEYPQFRYSTNVCHSVDAHFNSSNINCWTDECSSLVVTNLSEKYDIYILSIECYGITADFNTNSDLKLAPGESTIITFDADIPERSFMTADLCVNYFLPGSITPQGERTFSYQIMNGECSDYDESAKYASDKHNTDFDNFAGDLISEILRKTGFFDFFRMIFNCFFSMFIN